MQFHNRVVMWGCQAMGFSCLFFGVSHYFTDGQRPDAWLLCVFAVALFGIAAAIDEAAGSWEDAEDDGGEEG